MSKINPDDFKNATAFEVSCDTFNIRFDLTKISLCDEDWIRILGMVDEIDKIIDSQSGESGISWQKAS